ncbi:ATP-binding protein [Chitinispirillales bacterium ANBcel5]|uniref:GAF domain-containing sensor histidine kinase n=1 Tax=Cellulosispirillum alkaliphilum TaxID=3039283 RepID=UPI002A564354|nr:ATP-binding protein [Chitinispirillales bacterium ANBcel5]
MKKVGKHIKLFSFFMAAIAVYFLVVGLFVFECATYFYASYLFLVLFLVAYVYHKKSNYSFIIEKTREKTALIENTAEKARAQNQTLHSIHELALELSNKTKKEDIYSSVTKTLVKSFRYDLSQFWMFDHELKKLVCVGFYGDQKARLDQRDKYNKVLRKYLTKCFNEDSENKTQIICENMEDTTEIFLESTLSSAVISPLVHGGKTIGILTAEYHKGQGIGESDIQLVDSISNTTYAALAQQDIMLLDEKDKILENVKSLNENDELLVNSISSFAGDTLMKIELFSEMETKIENRTKELIRTHEELLKAREMIIQSEKLSSLGRMAAGVIHQINDSLNFLVNIVPDLKTDLKGLQKVYEFSLENIKNEDGLEEIKDIATEQDLDSHLEDMSFIFSRIEKALGKSLSIANSLGVFTSASNSDEILEADFYSLLDNVISMIPQKNKAGVEITLDQSCKLRWNINPNRMDQVFINLINNAIDAMNGEGKIEIFGERHSPNGLTLHFKDNGPGIPEEIQKKIFDPFFTTKPAGKSTGLGLAISAEIVRQFGGAISVTSKKGIGSHFVIKFSEELLPEKIGA